MLQSLAPHADIEKLQKITSFAYAIQSSSMDTKTSTLTQSLPDFPCDSLKLLAKIVEANPLTTPFKSIYRLYPFDSFLPNDSHESLQTLFDALQIETASKSESKQSRRWSRTKSTSEQKIVAVERPTLSQALLESDGNAFHKGKCGLLHPKFLSFQLQRFFKIISFSFRFSHASN